MKKEKAMLAVNAPKKLVARVQTLVCLVLAFLCLIFSFTAPLVSIDFKDAKVINEALDSLQEAGIDRSKIGEIPEKINVSAVNMYGVVGTFANLVKAAGAKDGEKAMSAVFDENGNLKEGAKTSVLIAAALATNVVGEAKDSSSSSSSSGFGAIVAMLIPIVATIALLIFSMIAPIYYVIAFLFVLVAVLKNLQNPEEATAKVSGRLPKTIIVPIYIMLYACVTKTLSPGSGVKTLFVLVILNSILNLVATRMHAWDKKPLKFANIVQGLSLVSVLGYIIYLFNIVKTGVFRTLITNNGFLVAAGKAAVNKAASAYTGTSTTVVEKQTFASDLLLVLVAIGIVLFSSRYLAAVLRRATLSLKKGDKPGHIIFAVVLMFSAILPMVVKTFLHDTTKNPAVSYLDSMTAEQNAALTGALVGLIIILLSEVALIILQKVFCEDISQEEMNEILTNTTTTADERIAKAKAVLEAEGVAAAKAEEKTEE